MTPRELMAAFDILADAPDGVKRLRELVLSLAVRGKLVEQDPADEPATPSNNPPVAEEIPFVLPHTWSWMRLPEVVSYAVGKTPATKEPRFWGSAEIPWVSIGDMPDGSIIHSTSRTVTAAAAAEVFHKPPVRAGTLLMSFKLTIGKVAILGVDAYHNEAIISITPNALAIRDYLARVLPKMALGGESKYAIMGATLNGQSLARILVPVPPLAEQHRIVARVDELMALLDRLEAAHKARDEARRAARDAALAALRDAPEADAVETAWTRIADQMDELFTMSDDVEALRQLVLHVAIAGLLVPRGSESQRLGAQAAHAPTGWTAGKMDDWFEVVGGIQKSGKRAPGTNAKPYLRVANVQRGRLLLEDLAKFELFDGELERYRLQDGDILVVEGNGSESEIGRCARWDAQIPDCVHQNHLIRCRPRVPGIEHFAILYLNSPRGMNTMRSLAVTTSGLYNLSVGKIKAIDILLPPLEEQHRIVAKVDALLALCDTLESRLRTARELHAQFAAAAAHHLDV